MRTGSMSRGAVLLRRNWKLALLFLPLWLQIIVVLSWVVLPSSPISDCSGFRVVLPTGQVVDNPGEITLRSGQELDIDRHICVSRPVDVRVVRSMSGPFYEELEPVDRHFSAGCADRFVAVDVDSGRLPAGRYWYAAEIDVYLNPLRPHFRVPLQGFWIDVVGNPPLPTGAD
jgi:hypothetical protein